MRRVFVFLILAASAPVFAQFDSLPDSPLDTSMGEATGNVGGATNEIPPQDKFEREQDQQKEEELLENRYDVPDDSEEDEFNKNGTQNP